MRPGYRRRLSSLEGRDLSTQSMKESVEKRGRLAWTWPSYALTRRIARNQPQTAKISLTLRLANRWSLRVTLAVALLRQRHLPFLPYHGYFSAKGDLLSIATQGLLLDLGPLTSWP